MKKSLPGLALMSIIASVVFADDKAADAKPTLEAECRAIAESHGVAPDQMGDWMKRCQERTKEAQRRMDEQNKARGAGGMDQGNSASTPGNSTQEGK